MRYDYIDIARGLAMLVVINWHILDIHNPWTDAWVMPIFFLIMGVFYKQEETIKVILKKKINTILVPHFFFSIPAFIIQLSTKPLMDVVKRILNPYESINGNSWFLVCMFWCYLIYYFVHQIAKGDTNKVLIYSLIISLIGFYMNEVSIMGHRLVLPFYFSTSMTCMGFIAIGERIRKWILTVPNKINTLWNILITGILFIGWGGVFILGVYPMEMIWNKYHQPFFEILYVAVTGSLFVISISRLLPSFLSILGKNSLLLLVTHAYVIRLLTICGIEKGWILYSLVVVITTFLTVIINKLFPVLTGKTKLIK